jgi:hypothetical protein
MTSTGIEVRLVSDIKQGNRKTSRVRPKCLVIHLAKIERSIV